ncbi:glycosyltransferase [Candidatus Dojkabacteria bacterium]|jgi:hypothetical protein|nr:glycosyltransferase [Candidatus Dojkabacteria bacterium]
MGISKLKIVYCGELDRTPDAPDHLGIRQGLKFFNGLVVDPVLHGDETAVRRIEAFKPDLIIHGNTDSLSRMLGTKFKEVSPKSKQVFWMLDYQPKMENYFYMNEWKLDQAYDAIFISNKDQIKEWGNVWKCPAYYLTHGCVVQKVQDIPDFNKGIVFIGGHNEGGWYNDRYYLIEAIRTLYPDLKMMNAETVDARNQVWRDMPYIYHSSDGILDVSHSWTADGYASGRYFYSAGLGGCSITKRFPGCEELYPPDCKLYFDKPEEALSHILKVKRDKTFRDKIKKNAWKWNKEHHHYKLKFQEIIEKVC